jgi:ABC-type lipoprotein release transport system permease subunit
VTSRDGGAPVLGVALVMAGLGLLAAIGPARRGLRIHPSEALREG